MNIKQIISITLLYTFSCIQCMEIASTENKAVTDIHLQKLIKNVNDISLNIVNIVKEHSHNIQQELTPNNMPLVLNLNQKQIDDMFLATVKDNDLRSLLFSMGADIKARTEDGRNCLWLITDPVLLRELLDKGAETDVIDSNKDSLLSSLFYFTKKEKIEAARIILERNKIDLTQPHYASILHNLIDYSDPALCLEAAQLLCKHKINVNIKDSLHCSALIAAIKKGFVDLVELFLQNGADKEINTPDYYEECPLHIAMEIEDSYYFSRTRKIIPKIVLFLLQYGANPNLAYRDGTTMPLHVAVDRNEPEIIKELINKKADKSCTNREGETAYDVAKRRGFKQDILDLLYIEPKKRISFEEYTESLRVREQNKQQAEEQQPHYSTSLCLIQ